jgi:hypothetical protein
MYGAICTSSPLSDSDVVPGLHTTLSPGACVIASLKPDGDVKLENMQYMNGSLVEMTENDGKSDRRKCSDAEITTSFSETRCHRRCYSAAIQFCVYAIQGYRRCHVDAT